MLFLVFLFPNDNVDDNNTHSQSASRNCIIPGPPRLKWSKILSKWIYWTIMLYCISWVMLLDSQLTEEHQNRIYGLSHFFGKNVFLQYSPLDDFYVVVKGLSTKADGISIQKRVKNMTCQSFIWSLFDYHMCLWCLWLFWILIEVRSRFCVEFFYHLKLEHFLKCAENIMFNKTKAKSAKHWSNCFGHQYLFNVTVVWQYIANNIMHWILDYILFIQ